MRYVDITGQRFGRLTVLREAERQRTKFLCQCDCGNQKIITSGHLRAGRTKSCGCLREETAGRVSIETAHLRIRHGHSSNRSSNRKHTRAYNSWDAMIQRCTNPNHESYKNYGGRGIKVCERWLIFENFLADMGEPPEGKSLDRHPDNDGNYEPGNCRWATQAEQRLTQRRRGAKFSVRFGTLDASEESDSASIIL